MGGSEVLAHLMATKELGKGGKGGVVDGEVAEAVAAIVPADVMELRLMASRYAA